MGFSNSVVGGITLVRPAIRSPNFVTGSTGWTINQDGSAEFNNAVIRGSLQVGTPYPYEIYGGAIPTEVATDPLGNTVTAIALRYVTSVDYEWIVCVAIDGSNFPNIWEVGINRQSTVRTATWYSRTTIAGSGIADPQVQRTIGSQGLGTLANTSTFTRFRYTQVFFGQGTDPNECALQIDGKDMARGFKVRIDDTASSGAIGAETVVLTTPTTTFYDGRAYEVMFGGRFSSSAAATVSFRVRKTNAAGQSLIYTQRQDAAANSSSFFYRGIVVRTAGTNLTATALVLTLAASAGTVTMVAAADTVRYLEVRDVGAAGDFPNAIAIT